MYAMSSNDPTSGSGPAGVVPNLGARTVVGVFDGLEGAEAAARGLQAAGFSQQDFSIAQQSAEAAPQVGAEHTRANRGIVTGVSAGAILGGVAGLGALAIPSFSSLIGAGPIAAVLGGAVAGGALGGLVGSFAGLGVPTEQAKEHETAVRAGGTVMSVKTADEATAERASRLLTEQGARSVSSYTPAL